MGVTAGAGIRGVGRIGGSDAPSAGDDIAGVGTRGAAGGVVTRGLAGGVETRGVAAGVTRGELIGVTGRDAIGGVGRLCGGTNGPGGVRR